MADLLNPTIDLIEDSPEVKSYIYQQISEFEPYVTQQTVITVIAKDPEKLALQYEADGKNVDLEDLKSHFRIAIRLSEGDARISAEGVDKDIFAAIRSAKELLLKKLVDIQDNIVSQKERNIAIHHALQNTTLH